MFIFIWAMELIILDMENKPDKSQQPSFLQLMFFVLLISTLLAYSIFI